MNLYLVIFLRYSRVRYDYALDTHVPDTRLFVSRLESNTSSYVAQCRCSIMNAVKCRQMTHFRISPKYRSRGPPTLASPMRLEFHGHILQDRLTIRLKGAVHHQSQLQKGPVQQWHRFLSLPSLQIAVYRCSRAQALAAHCLHYPLQCLYPHKYRPSPVHHHLSPLLSPIHLLYYPEPKHLPPKDAAMCYAERPRQ